MKWLLVCLVAACANRGSTTNDCDAAVKHGVDVTIAKRRAANAGALPDPELPAKLGAALVKTCVDDKWSAETITCFKTADDIASCKTKLTAAQRAAYKRAATDAMIGQVPLAEHKEATRIDFGSAGSGSAPATAGELPPECRDYGAVLDRYVRCAKIPQTKRDELERNYKAFAEMWKDLAKLPADKRQGMAAGCAKAAAEARADADTCGV